jgi:hypothetical protein
MDLRRGSHLSWLAGMIIVVLTTIAIIIIIHWLAGVYCVPSFLPTQKYLRPGGKGGLGSDTFSQLMRDDWMEKVYTNRDQGFGYNVLNTYIGGGMGQKRLWMTHTTG